MAKITVMVMNEVLNSGSTIHPINNHNITISKSRNLGSSYRWNVKIRPRASLSFLISSIQGTCFYVHTTTRQCYCDIISIPRGRYPLTMPRSESAVTTTPEDHHESDDLSNWGSERSSSNRDRRTISDDKQRPRRVSAPSSGPAPLRGASSRINHSGKSRGGTSTSANRRVGGGNSTKEGRIKPVERDINGDNGPAWNASARKPSTKAVRRPQGQPQAGQVTRQGVGVSRAHDKGAGETARVGGRQGVNRLKVKRASLGSVESIPTSISGRGTGGVQGDNLCAGSEPGGVELRRESKNAMDSTEDDDGLCSAAPSQDEIRVMIERIRLKTKDIPFDRAVGTRLSTCR